MAHAWPGNVRELRNMLERAIIVCEGELITPRYLPTTSPVAASTAWSGDPDALTVPSGSPCARWRTSRAADPGRQNNNKTRAADRLAISTKTLHNMLQRWGLLGADRLADGGPVIERRTRPSRGLLGELEAAVAGAAATGPTRRAPTWPERVAALPAWSGAGAEGGRRGADQLGPCGLQLNAIAGWTHILRMDGTTPATIGRAAEVFDRSVRTLTGLIETYTTARDRWIRGAFPPH